MCDYYGCLGIPTKQIKTKLGKKPLILHVCDNCYDEYLEDMKEDRPSGGTDKVKAN